MSFTNRRPLVYEDLIDIWLRIAPDNLEAADQVLDAIDESLENLASQPLMGAEYPSQNPETEGIRYFPVGKFPDYYIFYLPLDNGIDVLRVLNKNRDIPQLI